MCAQCGESVVKMINAFNKTVCGGITVLSGRYSGFNYRETSTTVAVLDIELKQYRTQLYDE